MAPLWAGGMVAGLLLGLLSKESAVCLPGIILGPVAVLCGQWGDMGLPPKQSTFLVHAMIAFPAFTPLLAAPLMPYKTVGVFLATIMAISGIGTMFILPSLVTLLEKYLFKKKATN